MSDIKTRFRHLYCFQLLILLCVTLTGCVKREALPKEAEGKVIVVATIFPLADWARNVGKDRVYVETLLPANASPHTFDPAPRDMRLVSKSQVFLKAGLQMDDWGASLVRSAGKSGPQVVSVGDTLLDAAKIPDVGHLDDDVETLGHDHEGHDHHGHSHGNVNPHFWLDPQLAMEAVLVIKDVLIKADPDGTEAYEANARAYIDELKAVDQELTKIFEPHAGKGFVSFHNAWPYFARRYQLKIAAVIEEYAGKTPSEKYLRDITDRLKGMGISTVFSEPQLNSRVAAVIAREIGGHVSVLDPYGTEGNPDRGTYIKTMRYNAAQLTKSLAPLASQN